MQQLKEHGCVKAIHSHLSFLSQKVSKLITMIEDCCPACRQQLISSSAASHSTQCVIVIDDSVFQRKDKTIMKQSTAYQG